MTQVSHKIIARLLASATVARFQRRLLADWRWENHDEFQSWSSHVTIRWVLITHLAQLQQKRWWWIARIVDCLQELFITSCTTVAVWESKKDEKWRGFPSRERQHNLSRRSVGAQESGKRPSTWANKESDRIKKFQCDLLWEKEREKKAGKPQRETCQIKIIILSRESTRSLPTRESPFVLSFLRPLTKEWKY